jgi:oligoribonuclease (3'-5' exoribonuclease)
MFLDILLNDYFLNIFKNNMNDTKTLTKKENNITAPFNFYMNSKIKEEELKNNILDYIKTTVPYNSKIISTTTNQDKSKLRNNRHRLGDFY